MILEILADLRIIHLDGDACGREDITATNAR